MRKINTESLEPGMINGRPIFTQNGIVLFNTGTVLTQGFIDKIIAAQIDFIYISDEISEGIESTEIISDEMTSVTKKVIFDSLNRFKSGHLSGNIKLINSVEAIITEVINNPRVMISLQEMRNKEEYMYMHALNVCIVSCIIGKRMEYSDKQMRLVALGALLHDVGKVQIDFDCTRYRDDYTEEEFEIYSEHCKIGEEMILNMREINSVVASVARQHHEQYDGSGFPYKLKGDSINELSRIVSIANEYDNLLYNMPKGEELKHYEIIEIITAKAFTAFDPSLIRVFRSSISPYPIGSGVQLNDGRVGIVAKINEAFPTRPLIRIIDSDNKTIIEEIDLSKSISLMIANEKDVDK
jgi:HD-GYP domain-containing protein (c-di-GMP phosphodiesterase class II)